MSPSPAHAAAGPRRACAAGRAASRRPLLRPALRPVSLAVYLLGAAPAALALPTGAALTSGQATVQQTAPGQMLILQGTPRAGLDWTSFSIAAGEAVNIVQPDRSAVLLNRVLGNDPSQIYGALRSNGSVWLINPRGIVFGASSRVDVGGLVASTLSISGDALAGGRLQLGAGSGGAGELRSEGQITAIDGSVVLVAPKLLHSGQIDARRVGLAAASEVLVDVEGDGLVFFNVRNQGLDTRLALLGGVRADGGSADIRAAARAGFADTVLNLEGVVQARGIGVREGRIVIDGGGHGSTRVAGTLDASAGADVGRGGSITVQGDRLQVEAGARLDATGPTGGGQILLGGDYQGRNAAVRNATHTTVAPGAVLDASATQAGDGGRIVVWSDDTTVFDGRAAVRGGPTRGHGGFVETSGKRNLGIVQGAVDLGAPAGRGGQWLLDPDNITVQAAGATATYPGINGATGDQTIAPAVLEAAGNAAPDAVITLAASQSITVNEAITFTAANSSLTLTGGGTGSITLNADIGTNNGAIAITSGTGGITQAAGTTLGSGTGTIALLAGGGPVSLSGSLVNSSSAANAITIGNASTLQIGNLGSGTAGTITLGHSGAGSQAAGTAITAGKLVKQGGGTLTLDQTNTYTGSTTVQGGGLMLSTALASGTIGVTGGTLATGAADLLASTAAVTVATGGTLSLGGSNTINTLSLGGNLAAGSLLTAATVTLTHGATVDSGFNATTALSSSGTTAIHSAVSAASTSITGGTLTLGATLASGNVTLSGGNLSTSGANLLASSAAVTVNGGSTLTLGGTNTIGALTLGGGALAGSALTVSGTVTAAATGSLPANLASAGSLVVSGGTLSVSTAVPTNTVTLSGGNLGTSAADLLADTANVTVATGSTLTLGGADTIGTLTLGGDLAAGGLLTAGSVTLTNGATVHGGVNATTALSSSGSAAISSAVTAASTTVTGGTLTLGGALTSNTVNVTGGSLALAGSGLLGSGATVTVASGATLDMGGTASIATLALAGSVSGASTLSTGTLNASVGGSTPLVDGNVTVTGGVDIGSGVQLSVGNGGSTGALAVGGTTTVNSGGTLVLNRDSALNLSDLLGPNAVAGGGTLRHAGTSTLTLDKVVTSLGAVEVTGSGGNLVLGNASSDRIGNGAAIRVASGSTLTMGNENEAVGTLNLGGTLSGVGRLNATSHTLQNGAVVNANLGGGAVTVTGNAALNGNAQTTSVTVNGGATLTLGATPDRIADGATLSLAPGGQLVLGGNEAVASATLAGTLTGSGTFTADTTLAAGAVVQAALGGATLRVTGNSTLNGTAAATTVQLDAGTLVLGSAHRLAPNATITVATPATLQIGGNENVLQLNLSGTLSGNTGTVTAGNTTGYVVSGGTVNAALGIGTLSVGGVSTLNAAVAAGSVGVLAGGTLTLAGGDLLADTTALTVASGATLVLGGNDRVGSLGLAGTLGGSGTLTANTYTLTSGRIAIGARLGRGALSSTGASELAGAAEVDTLAVNGGTLTLASAGRLVGNPAVTVATGATLALGGNESVASLLLAGTLGGSGTLDATTFTLDGGRVLADLGAGTLTSTGSSTLAGRSAATILNVDAGTLTLASAGRLLAAPITTVAAGAKLAMNGDETLGALAGAGSVDLGAAAPGPGGTTLTVGSRGDSRFDGVLSGAGTLAKTGNGSFTLGGSNTYAGSTAVAAGTLATAAAGVLPDTTAVRVDAGARLRLGGDDTVATLLLAGTLDGAATLEAATYTLSGGTANANLGRGRLVNSGGSSTLAGTSAAAEVAIEGGTLLLASADRLADTATLRIARGATLRITGDDTVTRADIAGTLAGTGVFSAATIALDAGLVDAALGGGTLSSTGLSRLNATSRAAALAVEGGTLTLGGAQRLLAAPAVTLAPGATLVLGGDETFGTLAGSGGLALGAATLRSGIGGDSSYDGVMAGSGGFVKQGSGSFTLAADQAYTGPTTLDGGTLVLAGTLATQVVQVNAGTLALAVPERLPDASPVTVAAGASLTLAGDERVASLALAGTLAGSGTLTATSYTLDGGTVDADLGSGALQSTGASRLNGRAAVDTVMVNGGTLTLGGPDRLSARPELTVAGGATLQLAGNQTVGSLAGAGTVALADHSLTSAGLADASFSGNLDGSGALVKQGNTTFTLSGVNGYTGITRVEGGTLALTGTLASLDVQVNAGTLALSGNERLADSAGVAVAAGALMSMAGIETIGHLSLAGTLTGNGGLVAASYALRGGTASVDSLGPGQLRSSGNSTLNSASAAGTVVVEDGTLTLGTGSRFTAAPAVTVADGATLALGGPETFGTLAGSGSVALASHTLNTGSGGSSSFAGVLGGSGELVKQGTTTFTLGGTNAATGTTRILSGTLQVDGSLASTALIVGPGATLALRAPERLSDTAFVHVQPGATLTLAGNETVASLLLAGTLAGSGTLSAASYSLDGGTANTELGTGTLTATGSSRLAAAAAAGSVAVNGGTLTLASGNLLADTAAVTVAGGATLALDATDRVASLVLAGTLAGSGTLSAATYLLDGGSANANLGAGALSSRGNSVLAGTAAVGVVTVQTGTLTLAAPQRLGAAAAVQLDAGSTLALVGDQVFGTLAGSGALALDGYTLATGSGGDSTFAGVISGTGGLIKQGSASVFTLTGANNYTGSTQVAAGTLRLGNGLNDGSPGATSGSLATSALQVEGLLELARADDIGLPQPVSGTGGVRQAGSGRLLLSGNNKTYSGDTTVAHGELATAGADVLPDTSAVVVAAAGRLVLAGRETVRSVAADGTVALADDLAASGDLLLRGAVTTAGPLQLSGERIEAVNAGNRFGGALSVDARGAVALAAGQDGGGVARDLVLGQVRAAAGGRIEAGRLSLGSSTAVDGGTLQLVATAQPGGLAPDAALAGRQAVALPIAWADDAVLAEAGSRIGVAAGAALDIVASGGGSVRLLDAGNRFAGSLSVVSGVPDAPWSVNATTLALGGGAAQSYALQSRVQVHGLTVNVGGAGIVADVVNIRADRLATAGTGAAIVARLPYDSDAGTASQLPGLTLELTPEAYNLSFPFGAPGADGGLRVNVGSRAYGNRTLPLDAGYATVLPRDGARGSTAVLLLGPTVNPAGGYRFFFDGAGRQTEIPVFYNGVLPTTPQVESSLSAAVAVSEGARKERFDEAVRTENVAVRLRAGVIAEVGPAPSATQGTEGLRVPASCPPLGTTLGCAKAP